ncbi:hypothetical protein ACFSR2_03240 [Emticicia soli]|uniref:Zinc finger C3HC4 RING-type domain-containing protein n=1 Tax=Emticicia soli TaxID=2027878 RepID=A0ABW5J312_9BACT
MKFCQHTFCSTCIFSTFKLILFPSFFY